MDSERKIPFGFVGLNGRGTGQLLTFIDIPGVTVTAVCDVYEDLAENAADIVNKKYGFRPAVYTDYKKMLADGGFEAVVCCTTWITHAEIAVAAMRSGYHVAFEVGGASDIEECWELIRAEEETGKHCMMLENCCYCKDELAIFRMERLGMFGEVVHCTGGYRHDLRNEILYGRELRHGRLDNFIHRNGELYPTHQLGPISKLLRINRGNRLMTLTSRASKARGLEYHLNNNVDGVEYLKGTRFNEGDVVDTLISCANGETIHLVHDCSLPRPYSRNYSVSGTKGVYQDAPFDNAIQFYEVKDRYGPNVLYGDDHWSKFSEYEEKYRHPLWTKYINDGVKEGHDGVDWLVLNAVVDSVRNDATPPIDVYDSALWMSITALSEQSVAMGGAPVPIPDFTKGKWIHREPFRRSIYCLEEICEECFE